MGCARQPALSSATGAQAWLIDNGKRLHLQHGPIDLIIDAVGGHAEVQRAYQQAVLAFDSVLDTLAGQLHKLRQVASQGADAMVFNGAVARRMQRAIEPYVKFSVTPMIAVAGAVADHVLSHMVKDCTLQRVMVNNGGDIALLLSPETAARVGICTSVAQRTPADIVTLKLEHGIGGIATSGWQGRSHSLGIADAVTVFAESAASADVAATLIANAVNLPDSPLIERQSARLLNPDSDLQDQLVTVQVGHLSEPDIARALNAGECRAREFHERGLLKCAYLHLQGQTTLVGVDPRTTIHPVSQTS